jgi:hypothetical protein
MAKITNSRTLAKRLWNATTMTDIEDIKAFLDTTGLTWHPVGDRENNAGIIDVATNPGAALVERVTNCGDAMLELAYLLDPQPFPTPFDAAQYYYKVPSGGLADMSDADRRALGERISVTLLDSGNERRPTVVVEDQGVGQSGRSLPDTILSLGASNKLSKLHLMGTYNQGGSASLSFSLATVLISRSHPAALSGEPDTVAFTIIEQRDDNMKKVANYEYIVDPGGEIMTLDPGLFPDLLYGTRIIHIGYDLQIQGPWTTNPYYFFQAALPSMPLPWVFGGKRTTPKDDPTDRVMIGNAARLARPDKARGDIEIPHSEDAVVDLGAFGKVRVRYWVVRRPLASTKTSDPTSSYVDASNAISITLNGQRQDTEPRQWINSKARLPFVYKQLVVQIDADNLTSQAKKQLFSSVRERARQSDVRTLIYDTLADLLRNDGELKRLDQEERERQLKRTSGTVNEKIRKRLGKYIQTALSGFTRPGGKTKVAESGGVGPAGTGTTYTSTSSTGSPRDTDDSRFGVVPTRIEFERDDVTLRQGARAHVMVSIDAKNGYLPDHDAELTIRVDGPNSDKVTVSARTRLMGGRARWVIEAAADAPIGDYKLSAALMVPSGVVMDATLPITVTKAKSPTPGKSPGSEPETGPNVRWIDRSDWDHSWNEHVVGRVAISDTSTDIIVNRDYDKLDAALKSAGLTGTQVQARADRYQGPVAYALWRQQHAVDLLAVPSDGPSEEWRRDEMERVAETVLFAITPDNELDEDSE